MKYLKYIIYSLLILYSCSDERIIDDTNQSWKALVIVNQPTPKLQLLEYPQGTILDDDVYYSANTERLMSAPDLIGEFGGFLFLIQKEEKKITIINAGDYKKVSEIDFKPDGKTPTGIAFHLTTAYVIFENDSLISPIDLTIFQKTPYINTGRICNSITADGNQVFITNPLDNMVTVIDTRVNDKVAEIIVPDYPILISFDRYGKAVVVSAGHGKIGADTTLKKTEAYMSLIDTVTRKVSGKQPLGIGIVKPTEQIPFSIAVASKLYAFIGTQQYLLRYNSRTAGSVVRLDNGYTESVIYNFKRDEILLIRKENGIKKLIVSPAQSFAISLTKTLPDGFVCLLPR